MPVSCASLQSSWSAYRPHRHVVQRLDIFGNLAGADHPLAGELMDTGGAGAGPSQLEVLDDGVLAVVPVDVDAVGP